MSSEFLILGACFFFVLSAVLAGGWWFLREPEQQAAPAGIPVLIGGPEEDEGGIRQTLERIGSVLPESAHSEHPLRRRLAMAGYRDADSLTAFFGVKAVAALVFSLFFVVIAILLDASFAPSLVFSLCGLGAGYFIPERVLRSRVSSRQARLRQALPPALDMLVLSLEAGQGLDSALLETSRELKRIYPDLSEEFAFACLEMKAGQSRADVLSRLAARTGEIEVRKLSNLLLDGDRFGTSLGPALRTHARYLRTRRRQAAQEQARKTSVKLVFPVFFLVFPSVLLVTLGPAILRLSAGMAQLLGSVK